MNHLGALESCLVVRDETRIFLAAPQQRTRPTKGRAVLHLRTGAPSPSLAKLAILVVHASLRPVQVPVKESKSTFTMDFMWSFEKFDLSAIGNP